MAVNQAEREIREYCPPLTRRGDFEEFWQEQLRLSQALPLQAEWKEIRYPVKTVRVFDLSYQGMEGIRVYGWFIIPAGNHGSVPDNGVNLEVKTENYPCMVCYHGYGGSRGVPSDHLKYVAMGMAVLAVDCRGQGGMTGDSAYHSGGYMDGLACKGVLDKREYYYRHVYLDAIRAMDVLAEREEVDQKRIVLHGISQGGGICMAVAALDHRAAAVLFDVPSNSDLRSRVETETGSFSAVGAFLKRYPDRMEDAYETLSYFDTMNLAEWIQCPVLASVSLKDRTCPAKLYFASYNRIQAEKQIAVYPYNGHENAAGPQMERNIMFLAEHELLEQT